jgi:hypothetical protein
MKSILFCLIALFSLLRPVISQATGLNPVHWIEINQKKFSADPGNLQKSAESYFYNDLPEFAEEDTTDPENENYPFISASAKNFYLASPDLYKLFERNIRYNGYFFIPGSSLFLFLSVFRL